MMIKYESTLNCLLGIFFSLLLLSWNYFYLCLIQFTIFCYMQSLFTGTIFSEIKITAFFLLSNDHLPFCFSWLFTEPWHYKKLFFKMWASISCLLGNCCFFADNFCTPIFILCGFICCDYYYIWGDLWCQFEILYRNATAFPNFIFLIWCTSKLPCDMLIRSKKLITTIQVVDVTGKPVNITPGSCLNLYA